jgi:hypothetical protein
MLHTGREPNGICLIAPSDVAWKSDLETLRRLGQGLPAATSLEFVAAKYLINDPRMHR